MNPGTEWLEADGLGGFASGTESTVRTRRYHALLLAAERPPGGRFVLVNGFDAEIETAEGARFALTSQRYAPDVVHPGGHARRVAFAAEPWPRWTFRAEDGTEVEHEIVALKGAPVVAVFFRLATRKPGVRLRVRPFLSGRDYHALHRENGAFRFEPETLGGGGGLAFRPYDGVPGVLSLSNGEFVRSPLWYRSFLYSEERERGLDAVEDLASPGELTFDLSAGEAAWVVAADLPEGRSAIDSAPAATIARRIRDRERKRRQALGSPRRLAADAYFVRRGERRTIVAGYPWFGDWGRDTFIALRGLALSRAGERRDDAKAILLDWADLVSEGMLPNRFPDSAAEAPEYNSVDASLWFVVAAGSLLSDAAGVAPRERERLRGAIEAILDGYSRGTRFGIRADPDGLLAAGSPGVQLTWMDARVGDRVVTPRVGKPVEIQALWANALAVGGAFDEKRLAALGRVRRAFAERFWDDARGYLADVVDDGHVAGRVDASFRPNQVYAVGGLPIPLLEGERARRVVAEVERRLLTPAGLRTLAPDDPRYAGRYGGGVEERDGAYHQGTAWPFLLGPFVEAWARVHGDGERAWREARRRFVEPLLGLIARTGVHHVAEIADGDAPYAFRGCPFQAWSLGELVRVESRSAAAPAASRKAMRPRDSARR